MLEMMRYTDSRIAPPKPKPLLKKVLGELDLTGDFSSIKRKWPEIEQINYGLGLFLTDLVPELDGQAESLFHKCIKQGINSWYSCNDRSNDLNNFCNYMKGLLTHLPEVLEWCVYTETRNGDNIWDPFEESLSQWWNRQQREVHIERRERPHDPTGMNIDPADYRLIILSKIISGRNLSGLDKNLGYVVGRVEELIA